MISHYQSRAQFLRCNRISYNFNRLFSSCLVVADCDGLDVSIGTLIALSVASKVGELSLLVLGNHANQLAKYTSIPTLSRILWIRNEALENPTTELISDNVTTILRSRQFNYIITPDTKFSRSYIPRVAASFDMAPLTDVVEIVNENTFKRYMYTGNIIATMKMNDPMKFLLIRTSCFENTITTNSTLGTDAIDLSKIEEISLQNSTISKKSVSKFMSSSYDKKGSNSMSSRPDLTGAKIVVAGGAGLQSKDSFDELERLADKLGAAVAGSRAAVDNRYLGSESLVGQSGKAVAPDLYIAVGISGAIQHVTGMKDSKAIVAINNDKNAPIFKVADYGLVGDASQIIPELTSKLT